MLLSELEANIDSLSEYVNEYIREYMPIRNLSVEKAKATYAMQRRREVKNFLRTSFKMNKKNHKGSFYKRLIISSSAKRDSYLLKLYQILQPDRINALAHAIKREPSIKANKDAGAKLSNVATRPVLQSPVFYIEARERGLMNDWQSENYFDKIVESDYLCNTPKFQELGLVVKQNEYKFINLD